MSIEIYPSDFSTRYEIANAISISETLEYNDFGKLTLVADADEYNIKVIRNGHIVFDTELKATYIIVTTKIETGSNRITANGYSADWLLNLRVAAGDTSHRKITNIESGVYDVVNANLRGLENRIQTAAIKGLTEVYQGDDETTADVDESIVYGGQLLDAITPVLEYGELGRRMLWDDATKKWTFEIYKGVDRTEGIHAAVFSAEQGTAKNLVITQDDKDWYTTAFVRWMWEGAAQMHLVGTCGANARELWVESSVSVEVEKDEDYATTKKKAIAEAMDALKEQNKRQSFTVTIAPEDFGTLYGMGDIVSCVSVRHNIKFTARVTGIKCTGDIRERKMEIVLGEPEMTIMELIKRNG